MGEYQRVRAIGAKILFLRLERPTKVNVIQQHVGTSLETIVLHRVVQPDFIAADLRLNSAVQAQMLAKDGGLPDFAFRPE